MSNVYSLSTVVEITFILRKLYLKKLINKQLNFSNSIFCSMCKTEQHFTIFFSVIIPKSTLQKRSIVYKKKYLIKAFYYYLSPLIIDLSYSKVLCKSVLLSSKNVTLCKLTSLIIPKSVF